jgi:hypothetical protein
LGQWFLEHWFFSRGRKRGKGSPTLPFDDVGVMVQIKTQMWEARSPRHAAQLRANRRRILLCGRTAASLTSPCRRRDVDPQLYLAQLLMNWPATSMRELQAASARKKDQSAKPRPACCAGRHFGTRNDAPANAV